jgi:hypothetical protein
LEDIDSSPKTQITEGGEDDAVPFRRKRGRFHNDDRRAKSQSRRESPDDTLKYKSKVMPFSSVTPKGKKLPPSRRVDVRFIPIPTILRTIAGRTESEDSPFHQRPYPEGSNRSTMIRMDLEGIAPRRRKTKR